MSLKAMNWAWHQELFPPSAKLVLLAIADHSDGEGICWPGTKGIAEKCSMSERNVRRMIRNLEDAELLRTEIERQKGHQSNSKFVLCLTEKKAGKTPSPAGQPDRQNIAQKEAVQPDNLTGSQPDNLTGSQPDNLTGSQPDKIDTTSRTKSTETGSDTYSREPKSKATYNTPPPPTKKIERNRNRFDDFWLAYPRKTGKKPSREKWGTKRLDNIADQIIADIHLRSENDRQWLEGFIPNPLTYLNQERWEDEIDYSPVSPGANIHISAAEARKRHETNLAAQHGQHHGGRTFDEHGRQVFDADGLGDIFS